MTELPSVTQVLSPYTDFSMVPPERLELATGRGIKLHGFVAVFQDCFTLIRRPIMKDM